MECAHWSVCHYHTDAGARSASQGIEPNGRKSSSVGRSLDPVRGLIGIVRAEALVKIECSMRLEARIIEVPAVMALYERLVVRIPVVAWKIPAFASVAVTPVYV